MELTRILERDLFNHNEWVKHLSQKLRVERDRDERRILQINLAEAIDNATRSAATLNRHLNQ